MTVYTEYRKIQHLGNNSLQTFSYNFEIPEEDYAFVYITAASGGGDTEYTDVTWSGIGEENGGVVVFNTYTPTSTDVITILRDVEIIQETDYIEGGLFRAETTEDTFDYSRFVDQQLKETLDRCIKAAVTDDSSAICMVLETAEERANKYLWFNEDGCVESREGVVSLPVHDHSNNVEGGQLHHHTFVGLLDDDHTQYHTDSRGDARYYTQSQVDSLLIHNHDGTYSLLGHLHTGTYAPTPHNNDHHSLTFITTSSVTFETLNANSDVGTGASTLAEGNHTHEFYSIPGTDHAAEGFKVSLTVGENVVFGNLLYMKSDGKLWKTTNTSGSSQEPGMAIALETKLANLSCSVLLEGFIRDDSWSWTIGQKIFMGAAGAMTTTLVAGSGTVVQVCGVALQASVIWFNPNFMVIERA